MLLIFRYSAQILLENASFCQQNARLKNRLFCSKFCRQNLSKLKAAPVVLFPMLQKVVLTFGSADEILKLDHSNESSVKQYLPVVLAVYYVKQDGSNFVSVNEIPSVTIQMKAAEQYFLVNTEYSGLSADINSSWHLLGEPPPLPPKKFFLNSWYYHTWIRSQRNSNYTLMSLISDH